MEKVIYIGEATKDYSTLIMLILGLVTALGFLYLIQTKKIKNLEGTYRQIGLLLGGFFFLILFATTLFTTWNLHSIQPVKLYGTYMESFHGKTSYKEIKKVGIFSDKEQSLINSQITIREDNILVVEKKDKKVMMFAEENYDLLELVTKIKEQMGH